MWTPDWRLDDETWLDWYHDMSRVIEAGPHRRSVNVAYDDEVEFETIRWLHEHADSGDDRPFALTVSFISPHDPYLAPPYWWDRYRDEEIDPPGVADVPLRERDPHSRRHWFLTGRHRADVGEPDVLRMRRAYYAVTSYVDAKVGRLLATLGEIGVADDTLVVFTSDHGDSLGERGLFFKMSFFEWSVRVPLIVHAPFTFSPRRVGANVSHLDLFPTLLEAAGDGALPELAAPIDGRSLAPLAAGGGRDWPDVVCAEYTAEGVRAPLLMVRKGPYKLISSPADPPLLFDLDADPDERENLAGRPACAGVRAELEAAVARDLGRPKRSMRRSARASPRAAWWVPRSTPEPAPPGTTSPCATPRGSTSARGATSRRHIRAPCGEAAQRARCASSGAKLRRRTAVSTVAYTERAGRRQERTNSGSWNPHGSLVHHHAKGGGREDNDDDS